MVVLWIRKGVGEGYDDVANIDLIKFCRSVSGPGGVWFVGVWFDNRGMYSVYSGDRRKERANKLHQDKSFAKTPSAI